MTIHPFPKSLRGSCGGRNPQMAVAAAVFLPPSDLTGVRQRTSASKLAAPAFFSCFDRNEDTQDDLGHSRIVVTKLVKRCPEGRDLLSRTEQVLAAAILADEAASDLLDRCVHLLNSLCDAPNNGDITWNSLSRKRPAIFGTETTEKFFRFGQ